MKSRTRFTIAPALAAVSVLATFLTACSSPNPSPQAAPTTGAPANVTIALDFTPNTNHIGIYVAQAKGYFKDASLKVKILPYSSTPAETLVANKRSDFGFSYSGGTAYARAAGQDVVQVYANISKNQYVLAYRASDTSISSPKDLDGKTYAGFGTPDESAEVSTVIKSDGGKGEFTKAVLDTAAYEAVYAGKADFTIAATTVEVLEAAEIGKPLKYFIPE